MASVLSNATLLALGDVAVPSYDRSALTAGIAHFGVGNFHRAHQAVYLDRVLAMPGNEEWGIIGVGIGDGDAAAAKAEAFRSQDGLYTLTEFAPDGTSAVRVIGAMIDYVHAPREVERTLAVLADPALRIVTLTITEGGYLLDEVTGEFRVDDAAVQAELAAGEPRTVFGFLAHALQRRRAAGIPPFTVVSCDNLRQNGETTRRALVGFAQAFEPELAEWIAEHVAFPNSMVDRIVPMVSAADADRLNAATGIADALPVMGESYLQWVMEDNFPAGRPPLEQVGVELRDDVAAFEAMKGRMLNASHVLLSYPALLCGYRLVHEAMADPQLRDLVETYLRDDAMPRVEGPEGVNLSDYAAMLVERYANPAVRDQLERVAGDGAAKLPVFHTETIRRIFANRGDLRRETLLLACYERYLGGVDDAGNSFTVFEPTLSDADRADLANEDGLGMMRIAPFGALTLTEHPRFVGEFMRMRELLATKGVRAALEEALAEA